MTLITHRPAVDYLRLTSFELTASQRLNRWIEERRMKPIGDGNEGGYEGSRGDGWFLGRSERKGKSHYLGRFSGALADRFMFDGGRPPNLDCTRIDLQLTLPTDITGRALYPHVLTLVDALDASEQRRGQRARSVHPISRPDGEFTIYLGNRAASSERFTRFYAKPVDGAWFLRFETEFKDKSGLAGKVYRTVGRSPESMVRILAGELSAWPPHPLIDPFKQQLVGVPADILKLERTRSTPHTTLRWIARQVFPAWKRLLGHEDTRDRAVDLLYELLAYAEGLDK